MGLFTITRSTWPSTVYWYVKNIPPDSSSTAPETAFTSLVSDNALLTKHAFSRDTSWQPSSRRKQDRGFVNDLRFKMEHLRLANRMRNPHVLQPQLLAHHRQQRRLDVIEISDDEDTVVTPEDLQRQAALNLRRSTMSDLNNVHSIRSGSDSGDDLPLTLQASNQDHRHKRPKLRHSSPDPQPAAKQNVKHCAPTPQAALGKRATVDELYSSDTQQSNVQSIKHQTGTPSESMRAPLAENNNVLDPKFPPYYYDTKLDIVMYRGLGYEHFPVVLGTVKGHQEICDRWMGKGNRVSPATQQENGQNSPLNDDETRCIQGVLEVFPDIQLDFLLQKIRDPSLLVNLITEEIDENFLPTIVISQILDMDDYPKAFSPPLSQSLETIPRDETGITVQYNKTRFIDGPYLKEAVILLAQQFTHVPTHVIHKIVHQKTGVFASYVHLQEAERDYYSKPQRPYVRYRQPRANIEKKYARRPNEERDHDSYKDIVNELQAAKQHVAREEIKAHRKKEQEEAEATNLAIHKASGSLVECQCCFDEEIPINRSVGCETEDDIHFFCYGCVASLAETQVGMMRYEMNCMDGSGCKASLSVDAVAQAISIKTLDRLAFNQQQAEIAAAGIEGLEQCPFCDFKAICEPLELDCVFNCQNPDCGRSTCRRCDLDAHVPRTCDEVKADKRLDARHQVEEARSDSVMRKCPKCGVRIVKEFGCNKVVCTSCRCIMCYVCKTNISTGKEGGYEHFNKPGAKCKLYDAQGVDQHEVEADEAEKEAIRKAKAQDGELDETELQVGTGPGQKKAAPPGVPQLLGEIAHLEHLLAPPPVAPGLNPVVHGREQPGNYILEPMAQQVWRQQVMHQRAQQREAHQAAIARLAQQQQAAGGIGADGQRLFDDPRAQLHVAQTAQRPTPQAQLQHVQRLVHDIRAIEAAEAQMRNRPAGWFGAQAAQPPRQQANPPGPRIGRPWRLAGKNVVFDLDIPLDVQADPLDRIFGDDNLAHFWKAPGQQ